MRKSLLILSIATAMACSGENDVASENSEPAVAETSENPQNAAGAESEGEEVSPPEAEAEVEEAEPEAEAEVEAALDPEPAAEPRELEAAQLRPIRPTRVNVSTVYRNNEEQAERLFDGDLETAWNSESTDIAQAVELDYRGELNAIELIVGYTKDNLFEQNRRVSELLVQTVGEDGLVVIDAYPVDPNEEDFQRVELRAPISDSVRLVFSQWVAGSRPDYREICISEMRLLGVPTLEDDASAIESGVIPPDELEPYPAGLDIKLTHVLHTLGQRSELDTTAADLTRGGMTEEEIAMVRQLLAEQGGEEHLPEFDGQAADSIGAGDDDDFGDDDDDDDEEDLESEATFGNSSTGIRITAVTLGPEVDGRQLAEERYSYSKTLDDRVYCHFTLENENQEASLVTLAWENPEGQRRSEPTEINVPARRRFVHFRYSSVGWRRPNQYFCVIRDENGDEIARRGFVVTD